MLHNLTPLNRPQSPRPATFKKMDAPNFEVDRTPGDTVEVQKPRRFKLSGRQQQRVAMFGALALACLPAASAVLAPPPPAPVARVVPPDSWVAGVPGRDVVKTRLEGNEFSLKSGHLTARQASDLRHRLHNLPQGGAELVDKLSQFDNIYDNYRLPVEPKDAGGGSKEKADPEMTQLIHQGFQLYDRNHDRAVTRRELTQALETTDGKIAAPAAAMSAIYGTLAGKLGYITRSSVQDNAYLARLTSVTLQREAKQPELLPLEKESFDSSRIRQHFQGSCVLLSTLLELSPKHLREMITDNHDGTYTVRFRNGKQATVSETNAAERAFFANTFEGERWPALFEKAVGAVRAADGVGGGDLIDGGHTIPPAEAIALMTGKVGEFRHMVALGPSGVREFLVEAQRRHEPIIAGMSRADESTGLIGHHEYAVKGFNPRTNMVTLRNPHGEGVWKGSKLDKNGLFEMPLGEFYNSFHNVTAVKD